MKQVLQAVNKYGSMVGIAGPTLSCPWPVCSQSENSLTWSPRVPYMRWGLCAGLISSTDSKYRRSEHTFLHVATVLCYEPTAFDAEQQLIIALPFICVIALMIRACACRIDCDSQLAPQRLPLGDLVLEYSLCHGRTTGYDK